MSSNKVKVHIEYYGSLECATRYLELQLKVLKECDGTHLKNLQMAGEVGRRSSFEVSINDTLVYSKIKKSAFPNIDKVGGFHQSKLDNLINGNL